MDLHQLFILREKIIDDAIARSESLPESERYKYIQIYIEAATEFYGTAMIEILDNGGDYKSKKSA